jgi:FKBP-type peptidyl-prolyl cis-trans isomerase
MKQLNFAFWAFWALTAAFLMACDDEETFDTNIQRERDEIIISDFLAENNITNFQRTPSGIFWHFLEEGSGSVVTPNTIVSVFYTGRVIYGKVFDSNFQSETPFRLQSGTGRILDRFDESGNPVFGGSVIPGWTQAIGLMRRGDFIRFYIPSQLGYGRTPQAGIPANSVLVFDILMVDF